MAKRIIQEICGLKFNRWTVISIGTKKQRWLCRCSCGTEREIFIPDLKSGKSKSCGCLKGEVTAARNFRHGKTFTREYEIWCGIKKRCYNPETEGWYLYGARGIKVCERWLNSFEAFLEDMGLCPEGMSIDRYPDKNGDYEPGNCRWATNAEQSRNKRNNHWITLDGETMIMEDWARRFGLTSMIICTRIRRGWSERDAIMRPRFG